MIVHWFLGQPDQALERIREALTIGRELSEPLSLAHALLFAAILYQLRREEQLAQEHADQAFAVSSEHGLALYQGMATIMQGRALLRHGRSEKVVENSLITQAEECFSQSIKVAQQQKAKSWDCARR
ncbi:MAG: hypothetical protein ICV60_03585 [Pyrinomonadaceae bacterium]|nr:hypothetical protein [Pyrinomonadaceae bacterium]